MDSNPYRSPSIDGDTPARTSRWLDLWYAVFPFYSVGYMGWIAWLAAPAGFASPYLPEGHSEHISEGAFRMLLAGMTPIFATVLLTTWLIWHWRTSRSLRLNWIMAAWLLPPVGCPLAYYLVRTATPSRTRSAGAG